LEIKLSKKFFYIITTLVTKNVANCVLSILTSSDIDTITVF